MSVSDEDIRAGDADRERAVEELRRATVEGKLTMEEFAERTDTAMASRTRGELAKLTADLGGSSVQSWQTPQAPPAARPLQPARVSSVTSHITAIMSENNRFGRWRAEGRLDIKSIMGSCKVDLRSAEIVGSLLDVHVTCLMAEVKIYVPRGLDIRFEVKSFMGSCKDIRGDSDILPGSPVIGISGSCVMGDVQVFSDDGKISEWQRQFLGGNE